MRIWGSIACIAVASTASAAPSLVQSISTHPGIVHETWQDTQQRIHVVRVDLTSAEIALFATKESDRGITTSAYGDRKAAQVVINGDAFSIAGYKPRGLAMGDKMMWSTVADDSVSAVFHLRRTATDTGERTTAAIIPPQPVTTVADLPAETESVIGGRPLLIRAGEVESELVGCDDPTTVPCNQPAPRSALALSEDGNTLYLIVVDGWQAGAKGMTIGELAAFVHGALNPYMAMALDGGSSSTLVLDGDLANQPSDGVERPVANHLAIKFGALPHGQLTGAICKGDVISCRDDLSLRLPSSEVTLDDGRVQVVGAPDALYNFTNITPRLACVTVRHDGYKTKTACDYVPSGGIGFESVELEPGMDPPDAGPDAGAFPDAAVAGPDAGAPPDAGGRPFDDGPAGCCDARTRPGGFAILAVVVGFMLRRRRGTNNST